MISKRRNQRLIIALAAGAMILAGCHTPSPSTPVAASPSAFEKAPDYILASKGARRILAYKNCPDLPDFNNPPDTWQYAGYTLTRAYNPYGWPKYVTAAPQSDGWPYGYGQLIASFYGNGLPDQVVVSFDYVAGLSGNLGWNISTTTYNCGTAPVPSPTPSQNTGGGASTPSPSPSPSPTSVPFLLAAEPTTFSPFTGSTTIKVSAPAGWVLTTRTIDGEVTIANGNGSKNFSWNGLVDQGTETETTLIGGLYNLKLRSTSDSETASKFITIDGIPGLDFTGDIASELLAPLQVADEDLDEEFPVRRAGSQPEPTRPGGVPEPLPEGITPISAEEMFVRASEPYVSPRTGLRTPWSVAGRSLDSHYHRPPNPNYPQSIWPAPIGSPLEVNKLAEKTIADLIGDPAGVEVKLVTDGRIVNNLGEPVFDFQVKEPSPFAGQGVRYGAKSHKFVNFLNKGE